MLLSLLSLVLVIVFNSDLNDYFSKFSKVMSPFFCLISCFVGSFLLLPQFKKEFSPKGAKSCNDSEGVCFSKYFAVFLITCLILLLILLFYSPFFYIIHDSDVINGDVKIEMNSLCPQGGVLPVKIKVTGPNSELFLNLTNEDLKHNLVGVDSIQLIPEHNSRGLIEGQNLMGNALGFGEYNVFINTSNLTEGYYELACECPTFNKHAVKGFYLFDSNDSNLYSLFPN